jgi:HMG (high mobility group) box
VKKPLTPFFLYRAEVYDKVKAENPGMKISKIASVIGEMWEHCDEETKSRLEDEYKKNKIIYEKEKKATV